MYVRVAAVKWGERLLIHPKFRELVIAKRHCTSNEVNMHKTDFGKRSSNTVKGSDIPVLNDGFRDFLKSIHKDSIYIKQPWCEWMSHILFPARCILGDWLNSFFSSSSTNTVFSKYAVLQTVFLLTKYPQNSPCVLTHCGRVTQICVFNTVKLGSSASSP